MIYYYSSISLHCCVKKSSEDENSLRTGNYTLASCFQGCWLWPYRYLMYTYSTVSREFVVVRGCLMANTIQLFA